MTPAELRAYESSVICDERGQWHARFDRLIIGDGFIKLYWNGEYVTSIRLLLPSPGQSLDITGVTGFVQLSGTPT